jgi:hypothetical protein
MQRRRLLKLGVAAAAFLALGGAGVSVWQPGLNRSRLSAAGREVFRAVSVAVLDGILPREPTAKARALNEHLERLDAAVAALPPVVRTDLSRLLAVLSSAPGRLVLTGLRKEWAKAEIPRVQTAMEAMRTSRLTLPQQAYHALRDLTMAAYFSGHSSWEMVGYPGPLDI